jgi:hypothetical protein
MNEQRAFTVVDTLLPITHDGSKPNELRERCCMCREFTPYWHVPKDVALCPSCANKTSLSELPIKREWCEKERKLTSSRPMWNEAKPIGELK